jgi:glycosyltransferase involved in cell wall biosynthesis
LVGLIRAKGADLVHSHEFTMAVYGAAAAAIARVPHVMTMHGNQKMTAAWRRRAALRLAFRYGGTAAAVSRATKLQLDRDLGLDHRVIRVAHNGVPLRQGDPLPVRHEFSLRPDELVLLAVGNLEPRKGHAILLRALARLVRGGLQRPWRLLIAGGRGGPEAEGLHAFIREHDMASRVHVLTHRVDVPDLQAAADVFVMPSLWEGLPLALLEAMVAGRAVIASDTSGIPEAVTNEVEGLLVPPADEEALSRALERVLTDGALCAALGRAAAERGRREFSVGAMTDRYEALYRVS